MPTRSVKRVSTAWPASPRPVTAPGRSPIRPPCRACSRWARSGSSARSRPAAGSPPSCRGHRHRTGCSPRASPTTAPAWTAAHLAWRSCRDSRPPAPPLGGTATAAAHVAAIAVLVLAHHPQFRPEPGRHPVARDASRADRLFQLILASCRPLPDLGPLRSGAGIPDAAVAVGVAPWGSHSRWHAAVPRWSASPGDPRGQEEPTRAALANLEAAMRSAGLISARAAPENQTAAERAGSLSRAGADAIGHAEQRFLCDARREPAVPAEDPAGVHPPGPRSTPAAGPSAPSRPAGPAGKTTRHGRCWSAPPGGICPAPGQAAEHVGDVGQGTGMERVIRQRIPARSHARDGHG